MINRSELALLQQALEKLSEGFQQLPDFTPDFDSKRAEQILLETAERMQDNYPYFHPQYAGQMLKPPHPVARVAYAMSLWVNPNNHALDGGRASSAMEMECVVELARMFGWEQPLGHLTGGGTMANLEALWVAARLHPGKRVIGSAQAHYTHSRISEVLGIPYSSVSVTRDGRMDLGDVERLLEQGDVGTVVATIGNTGLGAVDPLPGLLKLQQEYSFRLHADAAYGGYFGLASELQADTAAAYAALQDVDSIVIDPHKHGLQPYGCGCVLFKDPSVGSFYKHGSPFTYFSSAELHLGEISLECSRPGASAVALWATQKMLPLQRGGEFAAMLDQCLLAAREFWLRLRDCEDYQPLMHPELDIVVYAVNRGDSEAASKAARRVFEVAANKGLHLAMMDVPTSLAAQYLPDMEINGETICCLRSVLMKPEHRDWLDEISGILEAAVASA